MTVDEFILHLNDFGTKLEVGAGSYPEQAIEKIANDLKLMGITSKPQSNIRWGLEGDNPYLEIRDYLLFQNYGVKAVPWSTTNYNGSQTPVDTRWGLAPSSPPNFQFGIKKPKEGYNGWGASYSGLNAKADFDVDSGRYNLSEQFAFALEQIINKQTEI